MSKFAAALILLVSLGNNSLASAEGTAADLAGLKPVGWPLGVPMTCHAISDSIQSALTESVLRIQEFCNKQNEQMRAAGYRFCQRDECVESAQTSKGGFDAGNITLQLGRSEWNDGYYARLKYTFADSQLIGDRGSALVCFDPKLKAESLLQAELDSWDYQRFVEFCVKQ